VKGPEPELVVERRGAVRVLRLNRPQSANSLTPSLRHSLIEELIAATEDDTVRVVVLTGTGDRAFCGGADIKQLGQADSTGKRFRPPLNHPERHVIEVVIEMPKPVIAALNGSAVAAGFELALACDIRIAAPGARLGMPAVQIGMGADFSSVLLPRRIPLGIALEMLFTGEYISAEEAARWGLVNRVVPAEKVLEEACQLALKIAGNAPLAVERVKRMSVRADGLPVSAALRLDSGTNPYLSADRIEGVRARNEKRRPRWRRR
jgi:enoyl-CoA hydratase